LLGQGIAAVAVCKAATREDKAEAAWHADPSTKSSAVPAKRKAVELHVDLRACARRLLDLYAQQLVPMSPTELTTTSIG
jgi:4'-phosphopantetheinyl transferase EntD